TRTAATIAGISQRGRVLLCARAFGGRGRFCAFGFTRRCGGAGAVAAGGRETWAVSGGADVAISGFATRCARSDCACQLLPNVWAAARSSATRNAVAVGNRLETSAAN